jgi:uncharacterized membrane protein
MALTEFLKVFFTAAAPISELRGAIPLAILDLEVSWPLAFLVAFAGNLLPVPFILLLLDRILQAIFAISRRRGGIVERYGLLGLVVFVAIPLPVTGAWTGSIVAYLLGIEFRRAFPAIVLGVFIAGVIVTVLTEIGWWGALIAGVGFVLLVGIGFLRSRREAALSGHSGEEAMDEI